MISGNKVEKLKIYAIVMSKSDFFRLNIKNLVIFNAQQVWIFSEDRGLNACLEKFYNTLQPVCLIWLLE
jgi:hypothetical protein